MNNFNSIIKYTTIKHQLKYYTPGASGLDLHLVTFKPIDSESQYLTDNQGGKFILAPFGRALCGSGISVELPKNFEAQVRPRSSAFKQGLHVPLGTIDSDYRGEIFFGLYNFTHQHIFLDADVRLAQLVICELPRIEFVQTNVLNASSRGSGGFGSTGISDTATAFGCYGLTG